ncbi:hypothetical protein CANTEDRAFT_112432 [Yamadazyma tenuis ATCC 10573]|nr:uncharacterized protein CANTEDRAFT_112432 [Yamadazyma tenuis ATCC 10573]EGV66883.1 hypothetical protein CANTEDRAFT_112432 [Yamadazyma tenuis ATCC 10573]
MGALAKNVFDLNKFKDAVNDEKNAKRDAKNVYNLDDVKVGLSVLNSKRDAKNVYNLDDVKVGLSSLSSKRDAKNVVNFATFKSDVEAEQVQKRDQVVMEESTSALLLQSILPQYTSISVFAGYIRDNSEINEKTESLAESLLIICPTDNAISTKLGGLKPWEFPKSLSEGNEDEVVESNLSYFVSNHIVMNFEDLKITERSVKATLLSGKQVEIVQVGEKIGLVSDDGTKINVIMAKQVDNGYIFIIDDTLVKPN